ncbi:MAG: putative porin [Chthoniobacterales bacterium]
MSRILLTLLISSGVALAQTEPKGELVTTPAASAPAVEDERTETVAVTAATPAPVPASSTTPASAAAAAQSEADAQALDPTAATSAPELPKDPGLSEGPLTTSAPPGPSKSVTVNLINRLVERGVLTKEDAVELIQQAEADAQVAQQQVSATQAAITEAQQAAQQAIALTPPPPEDDGSVRVTYVPAIVKNQISEQVRDEVMAQAKEEGWAAPKLIPKWLNNFKPFADIRVRYEIDTFPSGNDNTGAFPNFNAINTGAPFNVAGDQFSPQLNVDQNRQRMRLRARFGADLALGQGFTSGIRVATGQDNSPVSTNQSLGLPYQNQGGNFSKYAIWLDRAFIQYELGGTPERNLALMVGRFNNPFFTVSSIMWDDDIGFDGIAGRAQYEVFRGFTPFVVGGAFPVYNTDFNYSSNQPAKFASYDKWLYAIQGGADWRINKDFRLKAGVGYFYFQNVQGQLSSPFTPLTANDAGDTDASRPSFAQKGNTYMALRDIVPNASNDFGTTNQWQYYGLATPYHNVDFVGRFDYLHFEPFIISLTGEWVQNTAFDQGAINEIAVNNRGSNDDDLSDTIGEFAGGNTAWTVQLTAGNETLANRWDWNIFGGYRYVESDAVIDGFTESDFGGGGTNLKGWLIGANLSVAANVWLGVRYMSAESIAGPPYKEDVVQFDINARF